MLRFTWSCWLPHGGRMQTGGWKIRRLTAELGTSKHHHGDGDCWRRLQPQDSMLFAMQHAVRGVGGYLMELGGCMTPPHCLYYHFHPGRQASAGDCPETTLQSGSGSHYPQSRYFCVLINGNESNEFGFPLPDVAADTPALERRF